MCGQDPAYVARRAILRTNVLNYRQGMPLPYVEYNELETQTWGTIYRTIRPKWLQYACEEYHAVLKLLEREIGYSDAAIPQFRDISAFLEATTGFSLHPVTGYLSPRDFLNGLAFRVFFCTQYIRHHSVPFYTQEPDICHEIMGHDADFADFSHEIGLASLGATDDEIVRLAAVYFISVEFGMYRRNGELKHEWRRELAPQAQVKAGVRAYIQSVDRPFIATYNPTTKTILEDRPVHVLLRA
ncbi:hypothetical protein DYB32_009399 [Aphanomyces invadans]|uniref:phenylalanine 4-monooxygenase n=1 Tax=Aphanomyces invadans TaxID=157072 RepID=A0A418AIQ9_9STRA|nr:hypothetical protein DYB32_009399 [Aphanomyces invadans]